MMRARRCSGGFTLLEILIAVGIFAVVAVVSFSSLNSVLTTRERTDRAADDLHRMQVGLAIMQRDFGQIVNVPIRDEYGDMQPALRIDERSDYRIELTRIGWNNPTNQFRSTLQRVAYQLEDDTLYRVYWPQLNRPPEQLPQRAPLLEDIDDIEFAFLDQDRNWHDQWPPLNSTATNTLPLAIRVTLIKLDDSEIIRLYNIAQ